MKKITKIIISAFLLFVIICIIKNPDERDMNSVIDSSTDYVMIKEFKDLKEIHTLFGRRYCYFHIDRKNYFLFSIFEIKTGWSGNINTLGYIIDTIGSKNYKETNVDCKMKVIGYMGYFKILTDKTTFK